MFIPGFIVFTTSKIIRYFWVFPHFSVFPHPPLQHVSHLIFQHYKIVNWNNGFTPFKIIIYFFSIFSLDYTITTCGTFNFYTLMFVPCKLWIEISCLLLKQLLKWCSLDVHLSFNMRHIKLFTHYKLMFILNVYDRKLAIKIITHHYRSGYDISIHNNPIHKKTCLFIDLQIKPFN